MRAVPPRSTLAQITTVLVAFAAGPLLGATLALRLTPDSELVHVASTFAFALVFIAGATVWMGFGIVTVVVTVISGMVRRGEAARGSIPSEGQLVPSGYRAFIFLGIGLGFSVGLLAALVSDLGVGLGVAVWGAAGAAYGYALRTAAHHGYLPFPEPE